MLFLLTAGVSLSVFCNFVSWFEKLSGMGINNLWKKASTHNIWSKVVAGIITAAITTLCVYIYSLIRSINFGSQIISIFSLHLKLWVYLIASVGIIIIWLLIRKFTSKFKKIDRLPVAKTSEVIAPSQKLISPAKKATSLIFDSGKTGESTYLPYPEKNWDQATKRLIGSKGEGRFEIKDNILTIERTNIDGRYIILLKEYYPLGVKSSFISSNIYGNNPRNLKLTYSARAISGSHKLNIVFKRKDTHHWLNNIETEITNNNWTNQAAGLIIYANENVFIEIHTTMISNSPGIVQIKDLKIEENK